MALTCAPVRLATMVPTVRSILMSVKNLAPLVSMAVLASTHLDPSNATVLLDLPVPAVKSTSTNVTQIRVKMKELAWMNVDRIVVFACLVSDNIFYTIFWIFCYYFQLPLKHHNPIDIG